MKKQIADKWVEALRSGKLFAIISIFALPALVFVTGEKVPRNGFLLLWLINSCAIVYYLVPEITDVIEKRWREL